MCLRLLWRSREIQRSDVDTRGQHGLLIRNVIDEARHHPWAVTLYAVDRLHLRRVRWQGGNGEGGQAAQFDRRPLDGDLHVDVAILDRIVVVVQQAVTADFVELHRDELGEWLLVLDQPFADGLRPWPLLSDLGAYDLVV